MLVLVALKGECMRFNANVLYGVFFSLVVFLVFYFLDSSTDFLITISVVVVGGIALSFIVENLTSKKVVPKTKDTKNDMSDINHNIVFSHQSLDARLENGLTNAENLFLSCGIYVGIYEDDKVHIIKQKVLENIYDIRTFVDLKNPENKIEELIKLFHAQDASEDNELPLDIENRSFKAFCYPLQTKTSLHPFGILMFLYRKKDKITSRTVDNMRYLSQSISFAVNMVYKKDELMKSSLEYYNKFNEIDDKLGIYNVGKIQKTIESEFNRYKRYLTPLSIVVFEIDDIKNMSNILSKEELLVIKKELANVIKSIIRVTDVFGIWRNETFVIIAQNIDYNATNAMVKKIQSTLANHSFSKIKQLTCSYGITSFSYKDDLQTFENRVYDALYKAQEKGNNKVETQLLV